MQQYLGSSPFLNITRPAAKNSASWDETAEKFAPGRQRTGWFNFLSRLLKPTASSVAVGLLVVLMIFPGTAALSREQAASSNPTASEILNKLEKRYDCGGFTARFEQTSTLAAMDITDTATGQAFFKHPGKMRWEYQQPSPQQIITNGKRLWIHKPEENQVVVGEAPALFGEEPGINFLTQIRQIKNKFQVELAEEEEQSAGNNHVLKLTPRKDSSDRPAEVAAVYLTVSKKNFNLIEIKTVSPYGDTTTIAFREIVLGREIDDDLFTFDIPIDADVITLDNQQP